MSNIGAHYFASDEVINSKSKELKTCYQTLTAMHWPITKMPNKLIKKNSKCLGNNPDLLDRIYCKDQNNPDLVAERHRCKDDMKFINDAIKAAVASGDAQKVEAQLEKLEQAVLQLEATYSQQENG